MFCCCSLAGTSACNHCNANGTANWNDTYTTNKIEPKQISICDYLSLTDDSICTPEINYTCSKCGSRISTSDIFCPFCKRKITWRDN